MTTRLHRRLLPLLLLAVPCWAWAQDTAGAPPPAVRPASECQGYDWAGVHHFEPPPAGRQAPQVVFMGDSITANWGARPFIAANARFLDRGISGQTTPQMLVRFPSDVIALRPAVVHIMAGTNDVAGNTGAESDDEIKGYIASMSELALANRIRVVLGAIPPAGKFPWRPAVQNPAARIRGLNAWIKSYAAHKHLVYADYWSALADPDGAMRAEFSSDGVHPNEHGYETMEPITARAIKAAGHSNAHD